MKSNIVVAMVFAIFIAVFAILNAAAIEVNLIFTKMQISAALVILISASLGAVIVYFIDAISDFKKKKNYKAMEKNYYTTLAENIELKEIQDKLKNDIETLKKTVESREDKEGVIDAEES